MRLFAVFAIVAVLTALLGWSEVASAAVPFTLTEQGRLVDDSGVSVPGSATFVFTIYDAPTAGNALWTEMQTVTLDDGYFSAELGNASALPGGVFIGGKRYIGMKVNGDPEMTPRQSVASVPYALIADNVTGDISPNSVSINGAQVIDANGHWVGPTLGLRGATGPAGPTGLAGPSGSPGLPGPAGATGPAGASGPAGPTGITGPPGATGSMGIMGAAGPIGPMGPAGGSSAGFAMLFATAAINHNLNCSGSTLLLDFDDTADRFLSPGFAYSPGLLTYVGAGNHHFMVSFQASFNSGNTEQDISGMELFKNGTGLNASSAFATRPAPSTAHAMTWGLSGQIIVTLTTNDSLSLENITGTCIDVNSGQPQPSASLSIFALD